MNFSVVHKPLKYAHMCLRKLYQHIDNLIGEYLQSGAESGCRAHGERDKQNSSAQFLIQITRLSGQYAQNTLGLMFKSFEALPQVYL